jgi:glucose/arabinose dehydrogenase
MKRLSFALIATLIHGPKPTAAFPGQTDAPPPSQPSPAFTVETLTTRLNSPWSMAFLPDGNFLVTESAGTMRIVRRDGVVLAPIDGVPGVKVVAAQGLHDILLDPDFASNRRLYFTYFAPPRGEEPAIWPNEYFYQLLLDQKQRIRDVRQGPDGALYLLARSGNLMRVTPKR